MANSTTELFWQACGAAGPLRFTVDDPRKPGGTRCEISHPFLLIGRDNVCDIILPHEQVSARHAFLSVIGGRVFAVDLRSRTGTHWDSAPARGGWLLPGQSLRIGPYTVRLEPDSGVPTDLSPGEGNPLKNNEAQPDRFPAVTLAFLNGNPPRSPWRMRRLLALVGQSSICKVKLLDAGIARFQGALLLTPLGPWVIDFGGRTSVNGAPVRVSPLAHDDRLQFANFAIRVAVEPEVKGQKSEVGGQPASDSEPIALPVPVTAGRSLAPVERSARGDVPAGQHSALSRAGSSALAHGNWLGGVELPASVDPTVLQLVNQFGLLQQQMFEQNQQTMMMMVKMFTSLHREHVDLVRDDLERLNEVTRELQVLYAEVKAHPPGAAAPPLSAPGSAAILPFPSPAVGPGSEPAAPRPRQTMPGPTARPKQAAPPERPRPEAEPARPVVAQAAQLLRKAAPAHELGAKAPPPDSPAENGAAPAAAANTEEVHAWLHQRMAHLQREQQTRWQRILGFIRDKLGG